MQRHWIFALSSALRPEYSKAFHLALNQALEAWQTHGKKVSYSTQVHYGQFVFIEALSGVSGCAIDWMGKAVQTVAERFETTLAGAQLVFVLNEGRAESFDYREVPQLLRAGRLGPATVVLDATVVQHGSFDGWQKPLHSSWLAKFLPAVAAA